MRSHSAGRHGGWKGWEVTSTLPEPMLTTPVPVLDLRPGCAAEPKWDGFRALVSVDASRVVLRSKSGTEMGPSSPEVVAGYAASASAAIPQGVGGCPGQVELHS